jgi:hypothetical protein
MVSELGFDRDAVKPKGVVPKLPSKFDASLTETTGWASSLRIVPCPRPSTIVAFVALERFTKNLSFGSNLMSPLTFTVAVPVVSPAGMVTVPLADW